MTLERAQIVRVAQLGPQLLEDGPVALLALVPDLALEVALEIGRDAISMSIRLYTALQREGLRE